jgi:hypothetical protein
MTEVSACYNALRCVLTAVVVGDSTVTAVQELHVALVTVEDDGTSFS